MNGEIVKHPSSSGAVARHGPATLEFTPEQRKMIRDSFLSGASDQEAEVLMELARLRRLNPITRQIHFVQRWDGQKKAMVWASQVGIDGFRAIAERTGLYDGQDEAEYEYDAKGGLKLARVRVYRRDWSRPAVGVAHFGEYAQRTKEGALTKMWADKPHVMLSKCAEALAFRKAFPEDTSGLYAPEEMPDSFGDSQTVAPPKPLPAARVVVQAVPPARAATPAADVPPPTDDDAPAPTREEAATPPSAFDPMEEALALLASAKTQADLAALTEQIIALGVSKDAKFRAAYSARAAAIKKGAA